MTILCFDFGLLQLWIVKLDESITKLAQLVNLTCNGITLDGHEPPQKKVEKKGGIKDKHYNEHYWALAGVDTVV